MRKRIFRSIESMGNKNVQTTTSKCARQIDPVKRKMSKMYRDDNGKICCNPYKILLASGAWRGAKGSSIFVQFHITIN